MALTQAVETKLFREAVGVAVADTSVEFKLTLMRFEGWVGVVKTGQGGGVGGWVGRRKEGCVPQGG